MDLKYRKAKEEDISAITDLANRIWKKYYTDIISIDQIEYMLKEMYSTENIVKQINEGHNYTLVYYQNKPIGYISISTKDNKNYLLHKFYIEIDEQRKGVGTEFFAHILDQLPNAETIQLTVNRQNYRAINFYFKKGFVIKGVVDFNIGDGYFMNDFIMVKKV